MRNLKKALRDVEVEWRVPESLVEVSTIDRFQGREADCVFLCLEDLGNISLTGSSRGKPSLLDDWRRLYVA